MSQTPLINHQRLQALIFLLALLQFCLFLHHRDITSAHEGRVAAAAREMLHGGDFLIPRANDQPRLQKPPLAYWLTAAAWSIGGARDVWLARFPAALCGAIATLLIADLARRTLGARSALPAALVWISTWFIVDEYRKAMSDPYLAFFTLLSIWCWITADHLRHQHHRSTRMLLPKGLIFLCYLSLALGSLAKGPLILLHSSLALIPYHLLLRRLPGLPFIQMVGAFIFLVISVTWPALILRHLPGAYDIWLHELTATSATSRAKSNPIWHYSVALPLISSPWTAFALIGLVMPLASRSRRDRRALWPLVWLGSTIIVFTFVPMKKNVYLLPAMPAQTLLIAAAIASSLRLPRAARLLRPERFLYIAHALGAIVAVGVTVYLLLSLERFEIDPPAPLLAAGAITLFALLGFHKLFPRPRSLRSVVIMAIAFAVAVHITVAWLMPDHDNRRSDAPFARSALQAAHGEPLILIGEGPREDVLFYLARTVPVFESIDDLPADFRGVAIVTQDERTAVRRSDRADELFTSSAERAAKDTLYLYRFPKSPPDTQQERR